MRTIYRYTFLAGIAVLIVVGISGCRPAEIPAPLAVTSTPTAIPMPIWLAHLPAGMVAVLNEDGSWGVESVASSAPQERSPVTTERVKNLSPSLEIGLDGAGNITGLPEGKTQEEKDTVRGFYEAIQKKFPTSKVFYNQDAGASEKWILYAALGGRLFQETVSYAGGPEQYFDYPISFDDAKGYWEIVGNYQAVEIPGNGEAGVIWEEGLPQLLADKATLPNCDSYFKYYMNYKTYVEDQNPWREVAGVAEILVTPTPEAPTLNPAEMQTEGGIHGVKLDATGSYQGITQNISVGITPDVNEFFGGKGVEFNNEASTVPVGDRLAEATLRAWYAAYLQRSNLSENAYSFETYLADYKSGRDVTVDEWVYDPATETNSVMKVGPDTHVMLVSAEGMGWYGVYHVYFQGFSFGIVKAPDGGIIIVQANANMSFDTNQEQILANIDAGIMTGLIWLYKPLSIQNGTEDFIPNSKGPEDTQIANLVHPDFFSNWTATKYLVTPVNP